MIRRVYIIGIIVLGLSATAGYTSPVLQRVVSSARSFGHYFRDLQNAGSSLSPIERFVFSLVLANTNATQPQPVCTAAAPHT